MPVVTELRRLGVRHYLCGSFASAFYGTYRATADVDVVAELSPSHVGAFVASLRADYYVDERMILDAIARKCCFNLIHLPTSFKVDVFVAKGRRYDRAALDRIHEEDLSDGTAPGMWFFLPSPEDVVLAKLEWYRLGDEISQQQWRDVIGVMQVNRHALDRPYLARWAAELGVTDLLARAWTEAETNCP
jgi:hypothetical protein